MQARLRRTSCRALTVPPDEAAKSPPRSPCSQSPRAGTARAATTLIVSGHGWGHGVGMSQWGAYGYALHGWGYKRILFHYYPGTSLEKGGEPNVRVLLVQGAQGREDRLRDADHGERRAPVHEAPAGEDVRRRAAAPAAGAPPRKGVRPFARGFAAFSCEHAPLTLGGRPYRGNLVVRSSGATLSVINALELDEYVRGVVPSESPARWPLAELEAQAVAARSYAVCATEAERALRPRARHAQPGLRRDGGRTPEEQLGRRVDGGSDPHVRRRGCADVLLVELRRTDRVGAGRVAGLGPDPVSPLGLRSVGHVLAEPRLGAVRVLARPARGRGSGSRARSSRPGSSGTRVCAPRRSGSASPPGKR